MLLKTHILIYLSDVCRFLITRIVFNFTNVSDSLSISCISLILKSKPSRTFDILDVSLSFHLLFYLYNVSTELMRECERVFKR